LDPDFALFDFVCLFVWWLACCALQQMAIRLSNKRKSKVIPVNAMMVYRGGVVQHHSFLTSALDAGEW
jgi:hypothetical protein